MGRLICLSALMISVLSTTSLTADTCDIPPEFTNQTSVVLDTLSVGFATDKVVYSSSDTVQFYLVVTNTGTETFHLNWGADPQDGFFVMPDTCPSIDWPGCLDDPNPILRDRFPFQSRDRRRLWLLLLGRDAAVRCHRGESTKRYRRGLSRMPHDRRGRREYHILVLGYVGSLFLRRSRPRPRLSRRNHRSH